MVLKDLMEAKQLNFNQPLLSVRRGSSKAAPAETERKVYNSRPSLPPLSNYKSDLRSGPFRNPGVVPFQWECMPGRPKDDNRAPKSPPGNPMQKQPYQMLSDSPISRSRYHTEINISCSSGSSSPDKILSEVEESERGQDDKGISSSEDKNVSFVDAWKTLSRSESYLNCSVSEMRRLDVPESSGVILDSQAWDFMIDRFPPVAEAAISETPSRTQMAKLKHQSSQANAIPDTWPNRTKARSVRTKPARAHACRDDKHIDGKRSNRGNLEKSVHENTLGLINELSSNVYLDRYGMARHKNSSPHMFLEEEKQFLDLPASGGPRASINLPKNDHTKVKLLAGHEDNEEIPGLVNLTEEKTLYVDCERMVESRHSNSSSQESRETNPSVDHSLQEISSLCYADEKALPQAPSSGTTYQNASSTSEKSFLDVEEDVKRLQKHDNDVKIAKPLKPGVRSIEHSESGSSALALTPFLPKSPSESWLLRTLSFRNPCSKSHLANHAFRASPVDPKQERQLKTSNLQNILFIAAEELASISENW